MDRHELFKFILQVFRDQGVLIESGCLTRTDSNSGVVFAERTVYTKLGKRCFLNLECYELLRRILLSRGPVQELHCIRDKLMQMIAKCLETYLRAPFDVSAQEMHCSLNRARIEKPDTPFEQYVVRNTFEDHIVQPSGSRVLRLTTSADLAFTWPNPPLPTKVFHLKYEYPTDDEVAAGDAIKRLSDVNKERVITACMDAFMRPDAVVRFVREFYRARRRMEDKERNRLYERQLTRFVLTDPNVMLIANPGAAELEFNA